MYINEMSTWGCASFCKMQSVSQWYSGRSILITGGTGFVGRVLVEKLLRSCPDIGTLYLLMRSKRGQEPIERLQHMLDVPLFDILRKENPKALDKIVVVRGDLTRLDLDVSDEDREVVLRDVSVVFHCAATVRFNEDIRSAVSKNVTAVESLMKQCRSMKKLEAIVHVSTAYCHCQWPELEEKVYPPPRNLRSLMQIIENLDDGALQKIAPEILAGYVNTYTFTKAIAESVLADQRDLPIVIVRPSVIMSTWQETVPGWIDNLNGPLAFMVLNAHGLGRSFPGNPKNKFDIVPVNMTVDVMICSAWNRANQKSKTIQVCNVASGELNPITLKGVLNHSMIAVTKYPLRNTLWYPGCTYFVTPFMVNAFWFLFLTIPSYVLDGILLLSGKKPKMVKMQKRLVIGKDLVSCFLMTEWKFHTRNIVKLWDSLSAKDKKIYNLDMKSIHWESYMTDLMRGTKQYILKEDLNHLDSERKHFARLKIIHYITIGLMCLFTIWILYVLSSTYIY